MQANCLDRQQQLSGNSCAFCFYKSERTIKRSYCNTKFWGGFFFTKILQSILFIFVLKAKWTGMESISERTTSKTEKQYLN